MKTACSLFGACASAALAALSTQAQVLLSEDFEAYTSDAALTDVWPRVSGTSAIVGQALDPAEDEARGQGIRQTTAAGRLRHTVAPTIPTDLAPLVFRFDFYDANGGTSSGRIYGELRHSTVATGLLAAGLYNVVDVGDFAQGRYQARDYDGSGWIQLDAVRSVGWHTFEFTIRASTVELRVDGVLDPQFNGVALDGGVAYDWVHLGSARAGNTGGNFDNVYLAVVPVPEPATAAVVVGLGLAILGGHRKATRRADRKGADQPAA